MTASPPRVVDALLVFAAATAVILVAAWPVVLHPTERIFGIESVGRHHDPFTVIQQFAGARLVGVPYLQPATDWTGRLLAMALPPIAAYNVVVLLTFPLAAWCAFAFAFELTGSRAGAMVSAFVFAFAPVHMAHAAYHPHIAQVQWIPLYFLALWRCVHGLSAWRACGLLASAAVAVLANDYHVLLLSAVTPVAVLVFWHAPSRTGDHGGPGDLIGTAALLAVSAATGYICLRYAVPAVVTAPAGGREELFTYSARWWSYLVPPVDHQTFGPWAQRLWARSGIEDGLLEQQVYAGVSVIVLAAVAVALARTRPARQRLWSLVVLGVVAAVCSLSPERRVFGLATVRPSALLYELMPMFRSYARFAVIVQLALAVLAGAGVDALWRRRRARPLAIALLALLAFEYSPLQAQARDVLPTSAHRYLANRLGSGADAHGALVFDCTRNSLAEYQTSWLAGFGIDYLSPAVDDCGEPALASKLRALGYRYLVTRPGAPERPSLDAPAAVGFRRVYRADDADVLEVTAAPASVFVTQWQGLSPREYDGARSWRWMGPSAQGVLRNASGSPVSGVLAIDLAAFGVPRHATIFIDGRPQQQAVIPTHPMTWTLPSVTLSPGPHVVVVASLDAAMSPRSVGVAEDDRALAFQIVNWRWR